MRRLTITIASLATLTALAACQEQRTVVVEQTQAGSMAANGMAAPTAHAPVRAAGAPQCAPPWGAGPFTPMGKPISGQPVPKPPRALAEHVNGCGGVRFRIGPAGVPQDVEVLAEYPVGYGFGDAVRQLIETSRWSPRDDLSWHYLNATIGTPRT